MKKKLIFIFGVIGILFTLTCVGSVTAHTDPAGWGPWALWENWGNPSVYNNVIGNETVGACSRFPGELDTFWVDMWGAGDVSPGIGLMTRWTGGTDWYQTDRPSRTYLAPAAVSMNSNRIDVFTNAYPYFYASEHRLEWTHWDPTDGWNYFSLPNAKTIHLKYSPAAAELSSSQLMVFFIDPDGHLRHLDYSDTTGWTHTAEEGALLGGDLTSSPTAASYTIKSGPYSTISTRYVYVFARGLNNKMWYRVGSQTLSIDPDITWGGWQMIPDPGSDLAGAPSAVSRYPGSVDVVYKRANGDTVMRSYSSGSWSGESWVYGFGEMTSDPTLVTWSQYHMNIFEVGTSGTDDNQVWVYPWNSPKPSISNVSPASATPGASFELTVNGNNFYPDSKINFNGVNITTTFVNEHTLKASVTAPSTTGIVPVKVMNPLDGVGGGGDSYIWLFPVSAAAITITVPNGGETFYTGSPLPMIWTYTGNPGTTVNIDVLKGTNILKTLTGIPIGTGGSGSYSVTIPSSTPLGSDYKIRITSASNSSYTDTSNGPFTISTPTITVTAPNGGETYSWGFTLPMSWSYTGNPGATVNIEVLKGAYILKVLSGIPTGSGGTGSYSVTIPYGTPLGNDYKIRVTSPVYASCTDTSNGPFTISGPVINVVTPNGGEIYHIGSQLPMSWTYTGNPGTTVNIDVFKGATVLKTLPGIPIGTGGSGSYSVTIPSSTPLGSDYKIRITSGSYAACTDMSNGMFTISASG